MERERTIARLRDGRVVSLKVTRKGANVTREDRHDRPKECAAGFDAHDELASPSNPIGTDDRRAYETVAACGRVDPHGTFGTPSGVYP